MSLLARLSKLLINQQEFFLRGWYSVRIDYTIVIEPQHSLTDHTFKTILLENHEIDKVGIFATESNLFEEYKGPYTLEKMYGMLVFQPC